MKVDQVMDIKLFKFLFGDDKDKSSFKIIAIENIYVGVPGKATDELLPSQMELLKLLEGPNININEEIETSLRLMERLPTPKTMNLSKLLVYCLHEKGISASDLAESFGVSKKTVYTYCNGGKILYNMLNAREDD